LSVTENSTFVSAARPRTSPPSSDRLRQPVTRNAVARMIGYSCCRGRYCRRTGLRPVRASPTDRSETCPTTALPNRLRRLLIPGNPRRVLVVLHALLKVGFRVLERLLVLQQIDRAQRQYLRGDQHALVADRRTDGGDVLPAVARTAGGETDRGQAA